MLDQSKFKASLTKPMFVFIALAVLNGVVTIAIAIAHFMHMKFFGSSIIYSNMWLWNLFINMALIGGWLSYVQIRRRKASQQQ